MTIQSREIRLKSRPVGMPNAGNFELATVDIPAPTEGEVQVRNLWMSVDPYMRGRMNESKSYIPSFKLGAPMEGGAVGEVIASKDPSLKVGDLVETMLGWREAFNAPAKSVRKLELNGLPPQAFLGVAGMPGLSAYAGLIRIAALKEGDIVFVSGAAGAVGTMVCQIAKLRGHKVIASAGGAEKIRVLKDEIGVDAVIDYKATSDLTAALAAAAPEGIDVYFDNVGGDHLQAALNAARSNARFTLCGMISMYNATGGSAGLSSANLMTIIGRGLRLEGFIVSNHWDMAPALLKDVFKWHSEGKLKWKETIRNGIESAPDAFLGLFSGENLGKMLVKL